MYDVYQDIFNKRGRQYHQAMQACPRARDREFELIVDLLPEQTARSTGVVCDMPSGGGYLIDYLPAHIDRLVGIETAKAFYELATQGPRFDKRLAELAQTGLADDAADAVLSLAGLHHVEDLPAVLSEIKRITRPGGTVAIADVAAGSPEDRFLDGFVNDHSSMGHSGRFVTRDTPAAIERAGMTINSYQHQRFAWRFENDQEMVGFCSLLFGIDQADPETVREAIETILGTQRETDGRVAMNWALTYIKAEA